jgi:glycosyltransferase involved in cell wall biosynthesis
MRYVWDLYEDYRSRSGLLGWAALGATVNKLRAWDRKAADGVTIFVANSRHVARRIERHYGRKSVTIYPPVEQLGVPDREPEDFYLVLGELVEYKRADLAVEACRRLGRKLVVIGDGPMLPVLRKRGGGDVRFLGWQSDEAVGDYLARCRAVLFCGQEDFGMVPVEAQSVGRPVIAYNAGGACETVVHNRTGILFDQQTPECLAEAIRTFEARTEAWDPQDLANQAAKFSPQVFDRQFADFITWAVQQWQQAGPPSVRDAIETAATEPLTWPEFQAGRKGNSI